MRNKLTAFPEQEYRRRLELVRYEMHQQGIDLLYVTNPSNMNWLTGYDGWSFYVHQGVLITFDSDPLWWGRRMDANGPRSRRQGGRARRPAPAGRIAGKA